MRMIHWLVQTENAHPALEEGRPPEDFLAAAEAAVYENLRIEKRRRDWLLGRWTAKQLIRGVYTNGQRPAPPMREIAILAAADGAPEVHLVTSSGTEPLPLTLSISHSHDTAACALIEQNDWPLGVDIECIESRSDGFIDSYFTTAEQELLTGIESKRLATRATAIWSGKESALKAVRQGLNMDTRAVSCLIPALNDPPESWTSFVITWNEERLEQPLATLTGWWRVTGSFVLTIAAVTDQNQQNFPTAQLWDEQ